MTDSTAGERKIQPMRWHLGQRRERAIGLKLRPARHIVEQHLHVIELNLTDSLLAK
jgi:hypothetical protein